MVVPTSTRVTPRASTPATTNTSSYFKYRVFSYYIKDYLSFNYAFILRASASLE